MVVISCAPADASASEPSSFRARLVPGSRWTTLPLGRFDRSWVGHDKIWARVSNNVTSPDPMIAFVAGTIRHKASSVSQKRGDYRPKPALTSAAVARDKVARWSSAMSDEQIDQSCPDSRGTVLQYPACQSVARQHATKRSTPCAAAGKIAGAVTPCAAACATGRGRLVQTGDDR